MALLAVATPAVSECLDDELRLRGEWGTARFTVEIADTPETRARGLMFRESMPRNAGMLFIYDRPQRVSFWMRNTPLPLDLIFLDDTGTVTRIHRDAIPFDETAIPGGSGVLAVLEINGGLSDIFGFAPGDQMQHPAFDRATAAWPCPEDPGPG
ncbi:MAG: DUF192 domain-containing protein [Rhodobacteraceae bacterium]|nr:DUF192 domain-containing protein [Paracoccaceae bacterium]